MKDKIITKENLLRRICRDTTIEEVKELNLVQRLKEATKTAWTKGFGLAAIQIGVPLKFAWFCWYGQEYFLLNPKIIEKKGKIRKVKEGCLSLPGRWCHVERAYKIVYESGGMRKTAKGEVAQIIQHEIDHINGKLIID